MSNSIILKLFIVYVIISRIACAYFMAVESYDHKYRGNDVTLADILGLLLPSLLLTEFFIISWLAGKIVIKRGKDEEH